MWTTSTIFAKAAVVGGVENTFFSVFVLLDFSDRPPAVGLKNEVGCVVFLSFSLATTIVLLHFFDWKEPLFFTRGSMLLKDRNRLGKCCDSSCRQRATREIISSRFSVCGMNEPAEMTGGLNKQSTRQNSILRSTFFFVIHALSKNERI